MWFLVFTIASCALVCALNVWALLRCERAREACAHSEARLLQLRGRVMGLEAAIESVDSKHKKLAGRIYATEHPREPKRSDADHGIETGDGGVAVCDRYVAAQLDGPFSEAARCTCDYCESMREQRARVRAAARGSVPKASK